MIFLVYGDIYREDVDGCNGYYDDVGVSADDYYGYDDCDDSNDVGDDDNNDNRDHDVERNENDDIDN